MKRKYLQLTLSGRIAFLLLAMLSFTALDTTAQVVLNNGKMRFGTGSENSVNSTGNLQQPFYFSTVSNDWRKLTYYNYSLNQTIAIEGDGTNEWNNTGTSINDAILENQVINTNQFIFDSGTSGAGRGKITSTGLININGNLLEIKNTYTLGESSFVTIETEIKNAGTSNITNLRYWIGTRDDYVGTTDGPTKERGNLVDGAFQILTDASDPSHAIRIKTGDEGVLFFSTSERAHTIINWCCSFSNVINQDPATSPITNTNDGSYGMYIRMNDLAPGQSDSFTWFYAAAKLSDLGGVVTEVAEAAGGLGNVTCNSAVYEANSNVAGTGYLMVVPDGSAAPTAAQVKAGVAYGEVTPLIAMSQVMDGSVEYELNVTGLTPATKYQAYFVLENSSSEFTDVIHNDITTAGNPEISFSATDANCLSSGDGQLVASATNGTEPFVFQWTDGPESDTYGDLNAGDYEVQVTDVNNCQSVATGTVGITDVIAPIAVAKDVTLYLDENGEATLTGDMMGDESSDNCELVSKTVSVSAFDCENMADQTSVTLTVEDAAGHTATDNALVTVLDTISPTVIVKDLEVSLNEDGEASILPEDADNGSSDNCGIAAMGLSKATFSCAELGSNEIVLTVFDASGNESSQTFTLTVTDTDAPSVEVQNLTVYLDANGEAAITDQDVIVSDSDNCGVSERSLDKSSFDCSDLAEAVTVVLTVKDASENQTSANVTVTVLDTISPVAAPQNITVALDANGEVHLSSEDIATLIGENSTDNCSLNISSHSLSTADFDCSNIGENVVTYRVEDTSGNYATADVTITIEDNTAPILALNDVVIYLDSEGNATLSKTDADNGSTDNCGIVSSAISKTEFSCEDAGSRKVIFTAMDGAGNYSTAEFNVDVRDTIAPVVNLVSDHAIYLDASGQASLTVAEVVSSATDNCGIAMKTLSKTSFDCGNAGVNNVSVLVEDNHGNHTYANGQITVLDTLKPTFNLPNIELVLNDEGVAELTQDMLLPYANDNCGIAEIAIQKSEFSCESVEYGSSTEIIVYDMNGNYIQQTLPVTVYDHTKPDVQVESDVIELSLNDQGNATLTLDMIEFQDRDNCAVQIRELSKTNFNCADLGTSRVSLTVTDYAGNSRSAGFTVNVSDHIAPMIIAPETLEVCAGIMPIAEISSRDNCSSELIQTSGPVAGEYVNPGSYEMVYKATDPSGNETIATVNLHVNALPEVDLGPDMEIPAGSVIDLNAGNENATSYLWSTGETTSHIQVEIENTQTISLTVTSEYGCNNFDEIVIKVNKTTGIEDAGQSGSVVLYPNPAHNQVSVALTGNQSLKDVDLRIIDINGKTVLSQEINSLSQGQPFVINLSDLSNGIYVVSLQSDNFKSHERIVKQ